MKILDRHEFDGDEQVGAASVTGCIARQRRRRIGQKMPVLRCFSKSRSIRTVKKE